MRVMSPPHDLLIEHCCTCRTLVLWNSPNKKICSPQVLAIALRTTRVTSRSSKTYDICLMPRRRRHLTFFFFSLFLNITSHSLPNEFGQNRPCV